MILCYPCFHSTLFLISSLNSLDGESGILDWVRRNHDLNHGILFLFFVLVTQFVSSCPRY